VSDPRLPSPLQRLEWSRLSGVQLWVKRDDLIHPIISGNKWRKLKGIFEATPGSPTSPQGEPTMVVSFGGAYSHHLSALALCLERQRWRGLFIVRGEELNERSNLTLRYCAERGVKMRFVSRARYQALRERGWSLTPEERAEWRIPEGAFTVPEGGDSPLASSGCEALWPELSAQWVERQAQAEHTPSIDELWLCAGTGATARGLLRGMPISSTTRVVVVSAVRGARREEAQTLRVAHEMGIGCEWVDERRFGGFGRQSEALIRLRAEGMEETGIWIDPVYQSKLWWELIERRDQLQGKRVVWLHTGGAQALSDP